MDAEEVLGRLHGVRRTGVGRWIAQCPAHDDRRPSLSLRRLDDGRVLIHCFGGCEVASILEKIGLRLADLFPRSMTRPAMRGERSPFNAWEALRCILTEAELCAVAADGLANGVPISEADRERLRLAAIRLNRAVELVDGR